MGFLGKLGLSKSSDSEKKSAEKHGKETPKKRSDKKGTKINGQVPSEIPMPSGSDGAPSMDKVSLYIDVLSKAQKGSDEGAVRIVRHLFALSEHKNDCCDSNRRALVHENSNKLLPVLLQFLQICDSGSQEQYLCLLVLNNLSIPDENKRIISLDCGGVHVLSRILCENPSCHLVAIILVNLTFADNDVRKELIRQNATNQLIGALTFALQVSMAPKEKAGLVNDVLPTQKGAFSPDLLLKSINDTASNSIFGYSLDPSNQLFPETARWSVCALKNLTRPPSDRAAIVAILDTSMLPLILQVVTVKTLSSLHDTESFGDTVSNSTGTPMVSHPEDNSASNNNSTLPPLVISLTESTEDPNAPCTWEANSIQDASLFLLLHLACCQEARGALLQSKAVHILCSIADYGIASGDALRNGGKGSLNNTSEEKLIQEFQCLKARMALSCLLGGEGHYGQPRARISSSIIRSDDSAILILPDEARLMVELFANTLHQRSKNGPGGYSGTSFSPKIVLQAIRCLLVTISNQRTFMSSCGIKLTSLLVKALAKHCFTDDSSIDATAAEHACFSLYLLSNIGFLRPFLPEYYEEDDLVAKVLSSYLFLAKTTPPGRHAADQLLRRLPFMIFEGAITSQEGTVASDFEFDAKLLQEANDIIIQPRDIGTKPLEDIFDRPILRSRSAKQGEPEGRKVSEYPSALYAVQQLSYGSTIVRHNEPIDDILIANNIASSANGLGTASYNYTWTWKDQAKKEVQKPSAGFFTKDEPFSIFGFRCG